MWTCDLCGSENILQQHSVMLPMNEDERLESKLHDTYADDYYFCEGCQEDCSPVKSVCNPLHRDYKPE